jgi:uncharacterized membrane protein YhaH (DUF805 family)
MLPVALAFHTILNNAYTMFCFILGFWALITTIRNQPIPGGFWGALVINGALPVIILILTILLQLGGLPPARGWVYYLYLIFFVIVLPGTFALLRGRDDRGAAGIYAAIILFTALAALTRSDLLTNYAVQMAQIK